MLILGSFPMSWRLRYWIELRHDEQKRLDINTKELMSHLLDGCSRDLKYENNSWDSS